jgi:glycosyltransferase involved in cell wall biosynthesis
MGLENNRNSRRKVIAIFAVDTVGGGGTEVWLRNLIATISADFEIILVSGSLHSEIKEHVKKYIHIPCPSVPAFVRVLIYSLISTFIKLPKSTVVHVIGAISFRKSDLNTVHFYHRENFRQRNFTILEEHSLLRRINRLIYTIQNTVMERVIFAKLITAQLATVSPEMRSLLEIDFCREVKLTHNGIVPENLSLQKSSSGENYLIFVGGDWARKGLKDVIASVSILKDFNAPLRLLIAGAGNQKRYLEFARELGVSELIEFLGPIERKRIPYSQDAILVCASRFEVSPLVFLEAAMCGTPVISYQVFGTLEGVQDGYLKICESSPLGLSSGILGILSDSKARNQMIVSGLKLRSSRSFKNVVLETISLYLN